MLALQKALGMSEGGQTGAFGPTTLETLLAFQADKGLEQTGKVGPTTWNQLKGVAFEGSADANAQGYDAAMGQALARASQRMNGGSRRSKSLCYRYVAQAVDAVMERFLYGGHAYMAAAQLAARKELFTEVSASSLGSLPAGALVVRSGASNECRKSKNTTASPRRHTAGALPAMTQHGSSGRMSHR